MKNFFTIIVLLIFVFISSSFAQLPWTKYPGNPVLTPGPYNSWEDYEVYAPFVLKDQDTLKMWYTGSRSFDLDHIGYATSTDGIQWQRYHSNPVLLAGTPGSWDDEVVGHPEIILIDTTYHMWYGGTGERPYYNFSVGYATSPDGINWTKYDDPSTTNPPFAQSDPVMTPGPPGSWDSASLAGASYFFDGDTFHVWYGGCDGPNWDNACIGYAKSPDGITWQKYPDPIFCGSGSSWDSVRVYVPFVIVDSSGYKMWYQGYDGLHNRIGYAISSDGINWTALENFVLGVGGSGNWDHEFVAHPHVFLDETIYRMWYSGARSNTGSRIGYATAPVTINIPNDYATIQEAIDAASDGNIVLVDNGTYQENINFKGKAITVASHFYIDGDTSHISNTIIDGSNPSHPDSGTVVSFNSREDTTSVLCGFTITGGTGTWFSEWNGRAGGGIGVYRSGAKIINNIIEHNTCRSTRSNTNAWGGGIDAFADTTEFNVIIEDNIIRYDTVYTEWSGYAGGLGVELTGGRVRNNVIEHNACFSESRNSVGGGVLISKDTSGYKILDFSNNIIRENLSRNYNGVYWSMAGGIMSWGSGTTIRDNVISNNRVRTQTSNWCIGAGLYCNFPLYEVYVQNNIITNNYFTGGSCRGGGICLRHACPEVSGNTISFNHATNGSGIFLDARLTSESMENQTIHFRSKRKSNTNTRSNEKLSGNNFIIKNTLSHNTATGYGGGMGLYYGDVVLIKNIIRENTAAIAAGGIEFGRSNSKAINNTIVNNSAGSAGGGGIVCYNNSDPDFINTIVWDNSAIGAGAQVNIYSADCDPNFDYCNIAGDSSGFGGAGSGSNYSGTYQNCLDADPLMVDSVLAVGDTMFCCLSSGSPCIDTGHPSHSCNDLNGTRNDIGAHGGQVDSLYYHLTGLFNDPENKVIPQKFVLKQNYPNPFNPVTTIEFSIPNTEQVKLIVYNMLGQEVETLVSKKLKPGEYKYIWNASQFASGVYFYKLEAGNPSTGSGQRYIKTKKLILLK